MGNVFRQIVIDVAIVVASYYGQPEISGWLQGLGLSSATAAEVITAVRVGAVLNGLSAVDPALGPKAGAA